MSFFTQVKTVTAAKPHKCSWCGEVIEKGTKYVTWARLGGYDAGVVKMHEECYEAHADGDYEDFVLYEGVRGK